MVGIIPQALDPDELSLVDALLSDPRVSAVKCFELILVVVECRCAW